MDRRSIYITDTDMERLEKLLMGTRRRSEKGKEYLQALVEELDLANVVSDRDMPKDIVTMRSRVRVNDLDSGEERVLTIVFPWEADSAQGKISVLAPIGTALLGQRVGDTVEWQVPRGQRRLRVEEILYQPEAAGEYHL
jgi:regulator of nucleoside diphosphate kinase